MVLESMFLFSQRAADVMLIVVGCFCSSIVCWNVVCAVVDWHNPLNALAMSINTSYAMNEWNVFDELTAEHWTAPVLKEKNPEDMWISFYNIDSSLANIFTVIAHFKFISSFVSIECLWTVFERRFQLMVVRTLLHGFIFGIEIQWAHLHWHSHLWHFFRLIRIQSWLRCLLMSHQWRWHQEEFNC